MQEWKKYIRQVEPYVPGEQPNVPGMIKLNTNECPYPPSPRVQEVTRQFSTESLRLYPEPDVGELVHGLAQAYGIQEDHIFVGVGSDDVLGVAFLTFFNSQKPILFPEVSYSFYPVWSDLFQIPYETPSLDGQNRIVNKDYQVPNGGIIFPNPNAPTGLFKPLDEIEELVADNRDVVVIVDEAYIDFGGESALALTSKYDNLLVVQTFSKSRALAGLRVGFAMGNPELIQAMKDVKFSYNSYTMNQYTIKAAVAALQDDPYFRQITGKIQQTREWCAKRFQELGFTFPQSCANFLFVSHRTVPAREIFTRLKEKKIYVRYFDKPGLDNSLRVTIGTDEEMEKLFVALEEILNCH